MINRNSLKCATCGASTTTRTAIGHDNYQEFAFPCHNCGIEIRFGMTLDQENVSFSYSKIVNATWLDAEDSSAPAHTFDGENLNPRNTSQISPFVATFHLPLDVEQFRKHQGIRLYATRTVWPSIERMVVHLERKQERFLRDELRQHGYKKALTNDSERMRGLVWATEHYGMVFTPPNPAQRRRIESHIDLAEKKAPAAIADVVTHFRSKGRHTSLAGELHRIRQQWVKIYGFLSPIYTSFYWDAAKHSLDDYAVGQKRFDELKPFYVDCFETLSRVSCIAAALDGVISKAAAIVPSKKGMTIGAFEAMANGSKREVLGNLTISDLFVPFMDSHLRNGMGHNAAHYDVATDVVSYVNENDKGKIEHKLPYVRLCEKSVILYAQLESVSLYANWLFVRCA